jgi:glycosyltransferase involved in cell wall biosynthesis
MGFIPDTTVVIPVHDRTDLLWRALESVYAQTHMPTQVVVIDDGSREDPTAELGDRFPQTEIIRQKHCGVSAARNRGIEMATGSWVAFLDSDDEWHPHKLERQLQALDKDPGYQICHTDEIWIRNGRRVNPRRRHAKMGGWIFRRCLPLCAISPSSVMIKRSLFDEVGVFDETLPVCEDYDLWLRICALHPVLFVDEPLVVKYGGHADQLSRQYWGMDRFRIRALENIIEAGVLGPEDRRAAAAMLVEKLDVYLEGARKRNKSEDVSKYEALRSSIMEESPWQNATGS